MVVAVALWSLELKPGQQESVVPPTDLRITNVALGDELADENARTSVKLTYRGPSSEEDEEESEDEEEEEDDAEPVTTVLCSLTPGKIEQTTVDLILEGEEEVLLENTGKNTVYLTGNYIDQIPRDPYDDEDDEDDFDSDEEAYRLEDVSSDVEIDADELDEEELEDDSHRFEEITDEPQQETQKPDSKKRPRDSDAMETDEPKLSKAQQKKLNKKLKAEDGKAVPAGAEKKEAEKPKAEEKKEQKKKEQPKKEEKKEAEKKKAGSSEVKTLEGGLKIQDHKVGTGPAAKAGNLVKVRYVGKLQNGKVFDSNTKGEPFKFKLGKGEVIKGWDLGIAGMQVGGERLLTIPPALAYGKRAQGGIPANSTLIFEVKLLGIN